MKWFLTRRRPAGRPAPGGRKLAGIEPEERRPGCVGSRVPARTHERNALQHRRLKGIHWCRRTSELKRRSLLSRPNPPSSTHSTPHGGSRQSEAFVPLMSRDLQEALRARGRRPSAPGGGAADGGGARPRRPWRARRRRRRVQRRAPRQQLQHVHARPPRLPGDAHTLPWFLF